MIVKPIFGDVFHKDTGTPLSQELSFRNAVNTARCAADLRNDRQSHKGKRNKRVHLLRHTHSVCTGTHLLDLLADIRIIPVRNQAHDRQFQGIIDAAVLDHRIAAFGTLQFVDGHENISVVIADYDDIVAVMRYGRSDGAAFQIKTDDCTDTDLPVA